MNDSMVSSMETLFLALGDKTRLRLLGLMANGPVAVGDLVNGIGDSQPKVSRHLAYLRNAGVVSTRRDGKWIFYSIEEPDDEELRSILNGAVESLAGKKTVSATRSAGTAKRKNRTGTKERRETQLIAAEDPQDLDLLNSDASDSNEVYYESESVYEEEEMDVFLL